MVSDNKDQDAEIGMAKMRAPNALISNSESDVEAKLGECMTQVAKSDEFDASEPNFKALRSEVISRGKVRWRFDDEVCPTGRKCAWWCVYVCVVRWVVVKLRLIHATYSSWIHGHRKFGASRTGETFLIYCRISELCKCGGRDKSPLSTRKGNCTKALEE